MFDSLTSSADGLFILLYIIVLVMFFLVGPHKVYESIFGALVGIGFYLLIYELTFVSPEFTRTIFLGNWMVENRGTLLWVAKIFFIGLFFITPMTIGLNVAGVVRDTLWFFIKVIILSAFFVCFGVILLGFLFPTGGALGQVPLFPGSLNDILYFKNSVAYHWLVDRSYFILFIGFLLGFYKILFSHWISRIVFFGGVVYMKGNQIFGKKTFDAPVTPDDSHGHGHDDHGASHDEHDDHHHGH